MVLRPSEQVTDERRIHPENAPVEIVVTDSGMTTLFSEKH